MHRIGNTTRWTGALVAAVVLALLAAAPAAGAEGCGQKIVDDWFEDGRVDKVYAIKCYREALKLLPEDAQNYSSAPDEINRALQDAIRQKQEEEAAQQAGQRTTETREPTTPPSESEETKTESQGSAKPTEAEAQQEEAEAALPLGEDGSGGGSAPSDPERSAGDVAGTTAEEPSASETAEDPNGVVGEAIGKLGSGSADSVPVPLIIIGVLALALLVAGGAALIARKLKTPNQ